jgi:hypothetical protein
MNREEKMLTMRVLRLHLTQGTLLFLAQNAIIPSAPQTLSFLKSR